MTREQFVKISDISRVLNLIKTSYGTLIESKMNLYRAAIENVRMLEDIKKELKDKIEHGDDKGNTVELYQQCNDVNKDIENMLQWWFDFQSKMYEEVISTESKIDRIVTLIERE